ncbi:colanic acid biosynthesis glycosyl transferase wcaE [Vibrio ishigakensis]|uniref:Colanic acid biosynthesis glycosyl transferase wcaE n=1 Tax=Vibrio ishigakensis TaxID=1481914 RepID=A0A0B8PJR9_9VIBR|nr:colanic acid biosynthesis glycosyl transferase wcaE [Vibrio ishigakensis]
MTKQNVTLSIIIASFNAKNELNDTITFLLKEFDHQIKEKLLEIVVIDGGSNDGTSELMRNIPTIRFLSESDNGIYDAMNKGVCLSFGKYCYFLSAGDKLIIENFNIILSELESSTVDVITANVDVYSRKKDFIRTTGSVINSREDFKKSMPVCHQATFFRNNHTLFYLPIFQLIGDKELLLRKFENKETFRHYNISIMNYFRDGFSANNTLLWKKENVVFSLLYFGISIDLVTKTISYCLERIKRIL